MKELVDNAWDADASEVWIALPAPMSDESLTVEDNGAGMKLAEVCNASDGIDQKRGKSY